MFRTTFFLILSFGIAVMAFILGLAANYRLNTQVPTYVVREVRTVVEQPTVTATPSATKKVLPTVKKVNVTEKTVPVVTK